MARLQSSGKVTLELSSVELEWVTVAVENELAMRGKELAGELLAFNTRVVGVLAPVYDRLCELGTASHRPIDLSLDRGGHR